MRPSAEVSRPHNSRAQHVPNRSDPGRSARARRGSRRSRAAVKAVVRRKAQLSRPAVLLTSAALLLPGVACAQAAPGSTAPALTSDSGLDLSGSVRLRYETIDNQARRGFNRNDDLFSMRTILSAHYRTGPVWLVADLYDSRAYLADRGTPVTANEVNTLEVVQAYIGVEMAGAFGRGTSLALQGGRFTLNIGSRRLVAADDYRNTTNDYTGLRADVAGKSGLNGTFIYVLPQVRLPDDLDSLLDNKPRMDRENFDQVLWGGAVSRANTIFGALAELSFYHFGERDAPGRPTLNRSLNSAGGRIIRVAKAGAFDFEVEAIYQFGHIRGSLAATAPGLDVSASFAHANAGYTFAGGWKPRVAIEFDRASGDGPGGSYGRFDTLFGMRRSDLAPSGLYGAVGRANILAPGIRVEAVPSKRVDWFVAYKLIWLADRTDAFSYSGVRDPSGRSGSFAGRQLDARIRYWLIQDRLRLELDGVWLTKGRFLREAPNAPPGGDTKYLSANFTTFF